MQNRALLQGVSRFTQSMAEGPVQVEHTRRFDLAGEVANQGQTHRRNAASFYSSRKQSNELRAKGSGRHQQGEVDSRLLHSHPHLVCWGGISSGCLVKVKP